MTDLVLSEILCQNSERQSQFSFLPSNHSKEKVESGMTMNRREFICGPAATGLAATAVASLPLHVLAFPGPIYWRGENGRVMCSEDGGGTWGEVMDLGPDCRVLEIQQHAGHLSCRVATGCHRFTLFSRDGRHWATSLQSIPKSRLTRRLEVGRGARHNRSAAQV